MLKFFIADLQINVNIGRYLYMPVFHTKWFAKRLFANWMRIFIYGSKSVTIDFD